MLLGLSKNKRQNVSAKNGLVYDAWQNELRHDFIETSSSYDPKRSARRQNVKKNPVTLQNGCLIFICRN